MFYFPICSGAGVVQNNFCLGWGVISFCVPACRTTKGVVVVGRKYSTLCVGGWVVFAVGNNGFYVVMLALMRYGEGGGVRRVNNDFAEE